MVELQEKSGFDTARKLMRWGVRNSLMNDFHVKRGKRHARWKYHEHHCVARKRWVREYWTRRWKSEVKNTANMALWWKFRVTATEEWDKEQYALYVEQRETKRLKQMAKEQEYTPWSLKECVEEQDYVTYTKTKSEEEYLLSIKPETILEKLRTRHLQRFAKKENAYRVWKNVYDEDVEQRIRSKQHNSNQQIKVKGIDGRSGYDWIQWNADMLVEHDPDYAAKHALMQQKHSDKQLLDEILQQTRTA
eukprot:CAMPEP_0202714550 /NCGR_PEP_ID=MMETSP1385-20130828/75575_1 /ASSEMBLY_ACC=CAM_ASM_000861 /TAXON_ID=933848 /ORGANISM="Elphidium margaritaceum" /LENGTH=247 /DNA_ID=CAMNT_0049375399 /DNA_START=1 /DNA_END=744 /DNA_ORIENTATION=+